MSFSPPPLPPKPSEHSHRAASSKGSHIASRSIEKRRKFWRFCGAGIAAVVVLAVCASVVWGVVTVRRTHDSSVSSSGTHAPASGNRKQQSSNNSDLPSPSPSPSPSSSAPDPLVEAKDLVERMSMDERIGQLVMASVAAGSDPSAVQSLIRDQHVGSVILMGNWSSGVAGVKQVTDVLQGYGDGHLLIATDQEGGLVQHLKGPGFDAIASATQQGQLPVNVLEQQARGWGAQLAQAGVNIDLAPSVDTVTIDRQANAPIGALDRDYALDAAGNAEHAIAFIKGMREAHVGTAPKHYPGIGSVAGNTDFTDEAIADTTTTEQGPEVSAFNTVIEQTHPAMVMVSLATYTQLDPHTPAAFSPTIVGHMLRGNAGYNGVVISDSLSASAVSTIAPNELGVRFIEAGGDIACINAPSYTQLILDGLKARAASDSAFAQKVTQSATRVVALKKQLGLM